MTERLCSSCKAVTDAAPPSRSVSAALCDGCVAALSAGSSQAKCREILQAIDAPVLLMQPNPRQVFTANDRALALFGRQLREAEGHRGGEVFGCIHSFTEAGCGKDVNCEDCRIKAAIVSAFMDADIARAAATLVIRQGSDTHYTLAISAENAGGYALVRIDRFEKERPLS